MRMRTGSRALKPRVVVCVIILAFGAALLKAAEEVADPLKNPNIPMAAEKSKGGQQPGGKLSRNVDELIANLPVDTTRQFQIREVQITGNSLLSCCELLKGLPAVYDSSTNDSAGPVSSYLYDFRGIKEIIAEPGKAQEVSARSMQGLTKYLLAVYAKHGYAGIYVYVPSEAFGEDKELKQGILPIKVIEAKVSDVAVRSFDVNGEPVEKGYLSHRSLLKWSPAKKGQVARRRELDEMVNLLNLNPDRYVSAVVTKGSDPESLSVGYDVYEANPWHFFGQVDNSGTKDRQWSPRVGIINTNTLGFDDILTLVYQTPLDKRAGDEYSAFGSYDFPIAGPKLRLNVYGGYNEFDVTGVGDVSFLGRGQFYGGTVRLNVIQADGWFFDVTGTLSHLESKITPSLFPNELGSDVDIDLWGMGVEIYRNEDMAETSVALQRFDSFDGSGDREVSLARSGAKSDFSIYTATVRDSRFLDADKIQNLTSSFRYVASDERLHPSQMTAFGGMYTVRGYDEYEVVADGGILASIQYEYDLVKRGQAQLRKSDRLVREQDRKPFVRKFAPLVFLDYGQARIENASATENSDQELCSWGFGGKLELGDNFTGVIYYGYPLIATEDTREGKGRINVGFLMRF